MSTAIDSNLLVLHGLAVKKAASAAAVASVVGVDQGETERTLGSARDAGRVIEAKGTYMLTPSGRTWLDQRYPTACAELRASDDFVRAYERFEGINGEILDLFTRWQSVSVGGSSLPNDHTDEDYDNKIVDELGEIHEQALSVMDSFSGVDPRFAIYRSRLESAYDEVLGGDKNYVSGARIDSYHTVWFELHEDILRMLGRKRRET